MSKLSIGDVAPDFSLKAQDDQVYSLGEFRGKPVVLVFYPLDFSPVCTDEHACFVNDMARFNELDAQVFGISVDSVWTHKAFAQKMGITYPLLADFHPKGAVAANYGVYLADKGIASRTIFLIDREGKVADTYGVDIPVVPDVEHVIEALKKMG
ncbi:MAG: peroxiredoxin [Chloroflexi bacterium]|nr:peroxiredoxin [Chloroflexota bacterium]